MSVYEVGESGSVRTQTCFDTWIVFLHQRDLRCFNEVTATNQWAIFYFKDALSKNGIKTCHYNAASSQFKNFEELKKHLLLLATQYNLNIEIYSTNPSTK